jgi:hypothetical protein
MLATRIVPAAPLPDTTTPAAHATDEPVPLATAAAMRSSSILGDRSAPDPAMASAASFPAMAVLVLRLGDDSALAEPASKEAPDPRFWRIVDFLKAAAERHAISYVKVVGADVFLAKGFNGDARDAARDLAEVALEARREATRLLHRAGLSPQFTIGLDCGSALGSTMGPSPGPYNVWGPALRIAAAMAATATPGTIQVSESVHRQLGDRFVFRRRGGFFVEKAGQMDTFVLQGRI